MGIAHWLWFMSGSGTPAKRSIVCFKFISDWFMVSIYRCTLSVTVPVRKFMDYCPILRLVITLSWVVSAIVIKVVRESIDVSVNFCCVNILSKSKYSPHCAFYW